MVRDVLLPLAGTIAPIVLLPLQRIAGGILRSPDCALDLTCLPLGFGFGVTHHLTDRLLDGAPYLHGGAFDTILVHGLLQTFESPVAANVRHTATLPDSPLSMTWAEYQKETNASDVMVHLHYLQNTDVACGWGIAGLKENDARAFEGAPDGSNSDVQPFFSLRISGIRKHAALLLPRELSVMEVVTTSFIYCGDIHVCRRQRSPSAPTETRPVRPTLHH
jgi:hypothetical protein